MGIKLKNNTNHDVLVLVFTYVMMPTPSLLYRKTLLIPSGEQENCPTWQSAIKIYACEAGTDGPILANRLKTRLGVINAGRIFLSMIGGDLAGWAADFIVGSALDVVVELIVNELVSMIIENTGESIQELALRGVEVPVVQKVFMFSANMLFVRRQIAVHGGAGNPLMIDGDGLAFF